MNKYSIIYADPPWSYNSTGTPAAKRPHLSRGEKTHTASHYYKTMKLKDIKELPISNITEDNALLYLWATTPLIQEAFDVMKSWGFKYKTMITWEKTNNDCMGYWYRVCTEHLLVGVKGKWKALRNMTRTCYHSKREQHSKKPDYFRHLIVESVGDFPRIELFARNKTVGWDVWGNEVISDIDFNR